MNAPKPIAQGEAHSKVPEVTLVFWVIKVAATTLGETAGDAVSMSMNLGYLVGTVIFAAIFIAAVAIQIAAKRFHPFLYWATIIATTTVGTTLADFADRSLGIGYAGGSTLLFTLLLGSLGIWYRTLSGSFEVARKRETLRFRVAHHALVLVAQRRSSETPTENFDRVRNAREQVVTPTFTCSIVTYMKTVPGPHRPPPNAARDDGCHALWRHDL